MVWHVYPLCVARIIPVTLVFLPTSFIAIVHFNRQVALEVEKVRASDVASRPPPPPDPVNAIEPIKGRQVILSITFINFEKDENNT